MATNVSDLRTLFENSVSQQKSVRQKRYDEGKAREKEWLERTQSFYDKIRFLNDYGFGLYVSVENQCGWKSYDDEKVIYIRSRATFGYINVRPDGKIICEMGFAYDKCFHNVEDFVKAMSKNIR